MADIVAPVAVVPVGSSSPEFTFLSTKSRRGAPNCSEIRGRSRRHRIAFNSLYLFSSKSINYEANGEALHNYTRGEGPSAVLPQGGGL